MKTLFFAVSLAATCFASPSYAQPTTGRAAVSIAGLDLATAKGQRALDLRILHTVSTLCGTPSPADARGRARFDACRGDAFASAAAMRDQAVAARQKETVEIAANQ